MTVSQRSRSFLLIWSTAHFPSDVKWIIDSRPPLSERGSVCVSERKEEKRRGRKRERRGRRTEGEKEKRRRKRGGGGGEGSFVFNRNTRRGKISKMDVGRPPK